jgi:hypothetical protein
MQVMPARKPRLFVQLDGAGQFSEGSSWHVNKLNMKDFKRPDVTEASFTIRTLSDLDAPYEISCDASWLSCSGYTGTLDGKNKTSDTITVRIDRSKMNGETAANIAVKMPAGSCTIIVDAAQPELNGLAEKTFVDTLGYIAIEAEHYYAAHDAGLAGFQVIEAYGKTLSGVKAFPTTQYFTAGEDAPSLEYRFVVEEAGEYEVELYMQPSNPVTTDNTIYYGIQANDGQIHVLNAIAKGQKVGEYNHNWAAGVLDNIRRHSSKIVCQGGLNSVKVFAVSPGLVLEKLVIYPVGKKPAESYLGPAETYYIGKV